MLNLDDEVGGFKTLAYLIASNLCALRLGFADGCLPAWLLPEHAILGSWSDFTGVVCALDRRASHCDIALSSPVIVTVTGFSDPTTLDHRL